MEQLSAAKLFLLVLAFMTPMLVGIGIIASGPLPIRPACDAPAGAASANRTEMPKGPQGQKRPADAIGAAITVAKISLTYKIFV